MNKFIKYRTEVRRRSDLLSLLSEACELEHGLACSYLYGAFSLKQDVDEGMSAQQLQIVRKWASRIYHIASQEMLHLGQAWNLLSAIGGTPYYFRPNFPQSNKYYPLNLPLKLEPFSIESLKRFIYYELPSSLDEKEFAKVSFGSEDDYSYQTVGELYGLIRTGFDQIDESVLFIGDPKLQLGQDDVDFREILKVFDRESASNAIDLITHQGEGTKTDREDSHYGIFLGIDRELRQALIEDPLFRPARNTVTNPIVFLKGNLAAGGGELIVNQRTRETSDIFDDIYESMLRALQFAFASTLDRELTLIFSRFAIRLMVRVLKPLGELLTKMPAYDDLLMKTAGPSFSLSRHIPLPTEFKIAHAIIRERSEDILLRLNDLKLDPVYANDLGIVRQNLADISLDF